MDILRLEAAQGCPFERNAMIKTTSGSAFLHPQAASVPRVLREAFADALFATRTQHCPPRSAQFFLDQDMEAGAGAGAAAPPLTAMQAFCRGLGVQPPG